MKSKSNIWAWNRIKNLWFQDIDNSSYTLTLKCFLRSTITFSWLIQNARQKKSISNFCIICSATRGSWILCSLEDLSTVGNSMISIIDAIIRGQLSPYIKLKTETVLVAIPMQNGNKVIQTILVKMKSG